ncbi:hypothetical protein ACOMHN_033722 [Nucella lapillus]
MSHRRYNFRSRTQSSPRYKEVDEDEESEEEDSDVNKESEEEDCVSPNRHTNQNTSHRSARDTSQSDASLLSSTASSSFSFQSASPRSAEKIYPDLPPKSSPRYSPEAKRRGIHPAVKAVPESRLSPPAAKKRHIENTYFGKTAMEWIMSILWAMAFIAIITMVKNRDSSGTVDSEVVSDFGKFSKQVEGLREQFPGQSNRFWRTVRSSTLHVLNSSQSTYPAVLLMVGEKKHATYVSRIAEAIQREFESVRLRSRPPGKLQPLNLTSFVGRLNKNQQKLELDEWLKEKLDYNHRVAVVVNHLESLLPEAALLLHSYCDGDNAPYKDVMLIFGLFFDQPMDNERAAEQALAKSWTTPVMKDRVWALLSRVANNLVLVQGPETKN